MSNGVVELRLVKSDDVVVGIELQENDAVYFLAFRQDLWPGLRIGKFPCRSSGGEWEREAVKVFGEEREANWEELAAQLAGALHDLAIVPIPWPRGQDGSELDRAEEILDVYRAACPTPVYSPQGQNAIKASGEGAMGEDTQYSLDHNYDAMATARAFMQLAMQTSPNQTCYIELTPEQYKRYHAVATLVHSMGLIPGPTLPTLVDFLLAEFGKAVTEHVCDVVENFYALAEELLEGEE